MASTTGDVGMKRSFVDTNVLVYAFDRADEDKRASARRLLSAADPGDLVLSAQVLNEFFVTVTRKLAEPLEVDVARSVVDELSHLEVVPVTSQLVQAGIDRVRRSQLSLWDGLIVEAALDGGCHRLLTEDLQAGQRFGDLEVVDPFGP